MTHSTLEQHGHPIIAVQLHTTVDVHYYSEYQIHVCCLRNPDTERSSFQKIIHWRTLLLRVVYSLRSTPYRVRTCCKSGPTIISDINIIYLEQSTYIYIIVHSSVRPLETHTHILIILARTFLPSLLRLSCVPEAGRVYIISKMVLCCPSFKTFLPVQQCGAIGTLYFIQ
jgi:hypothetical protein